MIVAQKYTDYHSRRTAPQRLSTLDTSPSHPAVAYSKAPRRTPLGPIGFSLAVDNCARSLKSPLNVWYLDDATLAGPIDRVTDDLSIMQNKLPELGLQLNSAKCEFTLLGRSCDDTRASLMKSMQDALPSIRDTPLDRLSLLGSPLGDSGIEAAAETAADTYLISMGLT